MAPKGQTLTGAKLPLPYSPFISVVARHGCGGKVSWFGVAASWLDRASGAGQPGRDGGQAGKQEAVHRPPEQRAIICAVWPGQFLFEIALLARKRQSPRSGVDSGENHVFRQNDALKQGVFQKQNAPGVACVIVTHPAWSFANAAVIQRVVQAGRRALRHPGRQHRAMLHNDKRSAGRAIVTSGMVLKAQAGCARRVCTKIDFKNM